jgi:hypothetical protein
MKKVFLIYYLQVKAWSSRGKVPHAVVSTAAFVEVSLRDEFKYGNISNHELRLLYSMVFIRYVLVFSVLAYPCLDLLVFNQNFINFFFLDL